VGNFHQIPCRFNGKRVGMLWNREAKGAGRPSGPPELASLLRASSSMSPAHRVCTVATWPRAWTPASVRPATRIASAST
jgi:hypothetical protein